MKGILKKGAAFAVGSEAAASLSLSNLATCSVLTNLIVPGHNDARRDIADMTAWIKENLSADVPLHFSRFFPNYQLTDLPATPVETLDRACDIARS